MQAVNKSMMAAALMLSAALLCTAGVTQAREIAGVSLDASIDVNGQPLVLNGAGLRKKLLFKLYVGSLYLTASGGNAKAIIDADAPMAIRLNILSELLTRDKMLAALNEGFEKSTGGNTAPIQGGIDQMVQAMQDAIEPGDQYTLSYLPDQGTSVMKNGESRVIIPGLAYKQALFGIWLSDKPAQKSLKEAMLGQ